jgi:glycerophosphoryl diester phosphodiesterase
MELIAHRGASRDAPENTLAAVNLAWAQNADAVEVDAHFSDDGQLVVIHDDHTGKVAGVRRKVRAQTLAELQALDVGRWKHARWAGERIPTLAEVVATIPNGRRLFVEIKCGPECVGEFDSVVQRSGRRPRQIVPIGFSLETLRLIKQRRPELEVCWVVAFRRHLTTGRWTPTAAKLVEQVQAAGVDGLDVGAHGPVDAKFAATVKAAGLKLYVWTVDSPAKARNLIAAGVDGITTNRPGWLREQLESA